MRRDGTSLRQFKACLANDVARARIGLRLTDEQSLRILGDDQVTNRWYEGWLARPDGAILTVRPTRRPDANPPTIVNSWWSRLLNGSRGHPERGSAVTS